jgi:hypothetical protein
MLRLLKLILKFFLMLLLNRCPVIGDTSSLFPLFFNMQLSGRERTTDSLQARKSQKGSSLPTRQDGADTSVLAQRWWLPESHYNRGLIPAKEAGRIKSYCQQDFFICNGLE